MLQWNFFIFILFPLLIGIWFFLEHKNLGETSPNIFLKKYSHTPKIKFLLWILRFIIIFLFLGIVGNFSFTQSITKSEPEPHHTTIILDISRSMLAEDIEPNRISIAKNAIKNFILSRKDDNFTMIIFAGKPFTVISKSNDQDGILHFLETISPSYIMQEKPWLSGTNIGDAILLAITENQNIDAHKNIILITDGSANIGSDPLKSTEIAKNLNIPIYTIGIGTKNNLPLSYTDINGQKNYFYDENGEKMIGDLDDELLQKIANETRGIYSTWESIKNLNIAFEKANANIGNKKIERIVIQNFALTPFFIFLLIIFLILENFIQKKFYRKYNILK